MRLSPKGLLSQVIPFLKHGRSFSSAAPIPLLFALLALLALPDASAQASAFASGRFELGNTSWVDEFDLKEQMIYRIDDRIESAAHAWLHYGEGRP